MADQNEEMMQVGKKEKNKEDKERKRDKREIRKTEKRKWRGRGTEKGRRWGKNILKIYRVTVKIRNRKAKKTLWGKCNLFKNRMNLWEEL